MVYPHVRATMKIIDHVSIFVRGFRSIPAPPAHARPVRMPAIAIRFESVQPPNYCAAQRDHDGLRVKLGRKKPC